VFVYAGATAAGYSSPLVEHHAKAARPGRLGRGIFRLVQFPRSDNEDLVRLWLSSGKKCHETALTLHQLSDDLPAKTHMNVPEAW
jgi:hypothetical protein